ncbi:MAG: hypothetical protein ACI4XC_04470 [Eubacterium sp.]
MKKNYDILFDNIFGYITVKDILKFENVKNKSYFSVLNDIKNLEYIKIGKEYMVKTTLYILKYCSESERKAAEYLLTYYGKNEKSTWDLNDLTSNLKIGKNLAYHILKEVGAEKNGHKLVAEKEKILDYLNKKYRIK